MNAPTRRPSSEINITPLVDVLLVLLIIFMVAQPELRRGYDSAIPAADVEKVTTASNTASVLRLDAADGGALGGIRLDGEPVAENELPARLRALAARGGRPAVFVDGDDGLNYEVLMRITDTVAAEPGVRLGFATEPIPS